METDARLSGASRRQLASGLGGGSIRGRSHLPSYIEAKKSQNLTVPKFHVSAHWD